MNPLAYPAHGGRAGIGVGAIAAFTCSEQSNSFAWERDVAPTVEGSAPTQRMPSDACSLDAGTDRAVFHALPSEIAPCDACSGEETPASQGVSAAGLSGGGSDGD